MSAAERANLIDQYARAAEKHLPRDVHDFFAGGSGDEIALAEAEQSWRRWRLRPRVLRAVGSVDFSRDLLGSRLEAPILVAPMAIQKLAHEEGERATAAGCLASGGLFIASTRSSMPLETIAATGVPWWMQVYVLRDRGLMRALVRRAADLGARALVLTGDTPVVARRRRADRPVAANLWRTLLPEHASDAACEQDPDTTLDDIGWLERESGLPVLVKGVLRADDARSCIAAGARGVVVSNHGGRQLDRAIASATALPEVAAAVGTSGIVLVDGGIRSGIDALIALALGAHAVCIGRPVIWGLAIDGATGVERVLRQVTEELREAMQLAGAASLAEVTRDLVQLLDASGRPRPEAGAPA